MFCPKCGTELEEGISFCTSCGAEIQSASEGGGAVSSQVGVQNENVAGGAPGAVVAQTQQPNTPKSPKRTKRTIAIGAGVAVVLVIAIVVVYNAFFAPYAIDENRFPDANLRSVISSQLDIDGDGVISRDEAASVENLVVSGASSIEGLEIFSNLKTLDVQGENLTSLDLEGCDSLKQVITQNCTHLDSVKLGNKPDLEVLDLQDSPVKELDVSGTTKLTTLQCDNFTELIGLDKTPLHEYWVVESVEFDGSATPSAYCNNTTATYDARGNLTQLVVANEQYSTTTYTYEYDSQDRCISTKESYARAGSTQDWKVTYNDKGLLTKAGYEGYSGGMSMGESYEALTYNDQGLPLTQEYVVAQGGASTHTFSYDANGALTQMKDASVDEVTYTFESDDAGRMISMSGFTSPSSTTPSVYTMAYDAQGHLSRMVHSSEFSNFTQTMEYDDTGKLINVKRDSVLSAGESVPKYFEASVASTKFDYNDQGLLVKVTPTRSGNGIIQSYSIGYKRLLIARDSAPVANFLDLSDPLNPHITGTYWSIEEHLYADRLPWQTSMQNIMAKISPVKSE